jgi:hypothetical protein
MASTSSVAFAGPICPFGVELSAASVRHCTLRAASETERDAWLKQLAQVSLKCTPASATEAVKHVKSVQSCEHVQNAEPLQNVVQSVESVPMTVVVETVDTDFGLLDVRGRERRASAAPLYTRAATVPVSRTRISTGTSPSAASLALVLPGKSKEGGEEIMFRCVDVDIYRTCIYCWCCLRVLLVCVL